MIKLKRFTGLFVAISILFTSVVQSAQAALVSSEQVAQTTISTTVSTTVQQDRARIISALSRADVRAELIKRGVDPAQVQDRVAALTDEEAGLVARQLDAAPAGGNAFIGAVVLVFLVLLVTDILGLTKIFPFTRSVR